MTEQLRRKRGRPKTLPPDTQNIHVNLPGAVVRWGQQHPEGLTGAIREAMRAAMRRDQAAQQRTQNAGLPLNPAS